MILLPVFVVLFVYKELIEDVLCVKYKSVFLNKESLKEYLEEDARRRHELDHIPVRLRCVLLLWEHTSTLLINIISNK